MGPIAAEAGGVEVGVTGGSAVEAIDRAMDSAGCVRLADVEADMVAMGVEPPPQSLKPTNRMIHSTSVPGWSLERDR